MVDRAQEHLEGAIIRPFTVATGNTVRRGFPVKMSGTNVVEAGAVGDNAIGISLDAGDGDDTTPTSNPTNRVRVAFFGKGVCKALVGSAGATAGAPAKYSSTGLTDATVGGGTTKLVVLGAFLETGVSGDLVGLNLGAFAFTVGS